MATRRPRSGETLQSTINAKGYHWTAGITTLSTLSVDEQKAHLGLNVDESELKATAKAIAAQEELHAVQMRAFAAPISVDWRNKGGDWTTPIKDQSDCGSCVAFATLATLESRLNIACENPNLDLDLAEAYLFYCGCGNCCGTGWNFPPALDFCKNTGVALEASFPYTPGDQPCKPGVTPYLKITNWTAVLGVTERKDVLATKGPMVAGMQVFEDFMSYRTGVYRHVSGVSRGYHAISVVGYDDTQQCWICKNSWGPGWGENGFFKIGYGECSIDTEFAFYDIDVKCPSPPVVDDCRRYVPALRRVLEVARVNSTLRRCLRYYVCGKPPRPQCPAAHLNVVRAVIQILQLCPQYREPFCRILG
jgi:C1A family cysteine protease